MIGFLIKDWKLLRRQGRTFGMMILIACSVAFIGSRDFSTFITSYMTFMVAMFSFSSFSYDDFDNGMAFLMSLPSGRKDYVRAKYLFTILLIAGGWLVGAFMRLILYALRFSMAEYMEILPSEPIYMLVCLIYTGLTFPALIRFGAEKGRNVAFSLLAVASIGVYLFFQTDLRIPILNMFDQLSGVSAVTALLLITAVCILVQFVSYLVSVRIIMKKEF